ncbi:MAG: hypothetical protein JWM98_3148 [Thermoleophilia bacterium]|nr:hypothetical protein [Thermoleophilia bacterium]
MAMGLQIDLDETGDVVVSGAGAGTPLAMLLEGDIGADLETVEEVLAAFASVQGGLVPRFERTWNVSKLVMEPGSSTITHTFRGADPTPHPVPGDELRDALVRVRSLLLQP